MIVDIKYLTYNQVNKTKWDERIKAAGNGILYASSGYLNQMAPQWNALVLKDYEIIMPLPWRKKFGISYLFQPSISPALGIFGDGITAEITDAFLANIPAKFKVWDISFNSSNKILPNKGTLIQRNNFVLNLDTAYSRIQQNYSENIRRNIAKAIKSGCVISKEISFDTVANICKKEFPAFTRVEDGLFEKLQQVYIAYKAQSVSYGVFSGEGKLLASCIFLFFKKRAYYWLVGNTPQSKLYGASSLLLDNFIKDHAGRDLLLDFEGSDTASVAEFYKKFGSVAEPYTTLYLNKLPFPFNFLKPLPAHYQQITLK